MMVTLQPVTMVMPTKEDIYAPSRLRAKKVITQAEFLARYADHPLSLWVSFAPDGRSEPKPTTAYGFGMDGWWQAAPAQDARR